VVGESVNRGRGGLSKFAAGYVALCVAVMVVTDSDLLRVGLGTSIVASVIAFFFSRRLTEPSLRRAFRVSGLLAILSVAVMVTLWSRHGGSAVAGAAHPGFYYLSKDGRSIVVGKRVYYGVAFAEIAAMVLVPTLLVFGSVSPEETHQVR
jgi:hypothetical protein